MEIKKRIMAPNDFILRIFQVLALFLYIDMKKKKKRKNKFKEFSRIF